MWVASMEEVRSWYDAGQLVDLQPLGMWVWTLAEGKNQVTVTPRLPWPRVDASEQDVGAMDVDRRLASSSDPESSPRPRRQPSRVLTVLFRDLHEYFYSYGALLAAMKARPAVCSEVSALRVASRSCRGVGRCRAARVVLRARVHLVPIL